MGNAIAPAELIESNPSSSRSKPVHPAGHDRAGSIVSNQSEPKQPNQSAEDSSADLLANANSKKALSMSPLQQLFFAAAHGDVELIRSSVNAGANVNLPDRGYEAFLEEMKANEKKTLTKEEKKELREQEAQFKAAPISYDYAIHKAIEVGSLPSVELLYLLEANLEAKNKLGATALHRAVSCGKTDIVKYLLGVGARTTAQAVSGNTPLHVASYQGNLEVATLLLHHRKELAWKLVLIPNASGLTPLDYARKKPMHDLLSSFRMNGSATNSFVGLKPENPADPTIAHTSSFSAANALTSGSRRESLKALSLQHSSTPGTPQPHRHSFQPNAPIATFINQSVHLNQQAATVEDRLYSSSVTTLPAPSSVRVNPEVETEPVDETNVVNGQYSRQATRTSSHPDSPAHMPTYFKTQSTDSLMPGTPDDRQTGEPHEASSPTSEVQTTSPLVPAMKTAESSSEQIVEQGKEHQQYSDLSLSMEQ